MLAMTASGGVIKSRPDVVPMAEGGIIGVEAAAGGGRRQSERNNRHQASNIGITRVYQRMAATAAACKHRKSGSRK